MNDCFLKHLRTKAKKGMRGWPTATIAFYSPRREPGQQGRRRHRVSEHTEVGSTRVMCATTPYRQKIGIAESGNCLGGCSIVRQGDNSVLPSNDSQIAMEQGIMVAEVNVAIGL